MYLGFFKPHLALILFMTLTVGYGRKGLQDRGPALISTGAADSPPWGRAFPYSLVAAACSSAAVAVGCSFAYSADRSAAVGG